MRHGPATDRDWCTERGKPDALRPLTADGRRRTRRAARGLARVVPSLDLVATSPLLRAMQTAEIVARACGDARKLTVSELRPGTSPAALGAWLQTRRESVIALVGHEPDLGLLVGWLLTSAPIALTPFKKGQACLLEFDGRARPGGGRLSWSLTSRQLGGLAR